MTLVNLYLLLKTLVFDHLIYILLGFTCGNLIEYVQLLKKRDSKKEQVGGIHKSCQVDMKTSNV